MSQYVEKLSLNLRQDQRYEKVITEYLEDIKSDEVIDSLITLFKSRLDNLLATVALQSEEISNLKKEISNIQIKDNNETDTSIS